MKLTNYTEIPDEQIREMIRFSCPTNVSKFDIQIKNCGNGSWIIGRAYWAGCSYHGNRTPLINVRIPKKVQRKEIFTGYTKIVLNGKECNQCNFEKRNIAIKMNYPRIHKGFKGYLTYVLLNQDEEILHVIAHELRHLWQSKVKKGWRVWGAKGQFSERDADAFAMKMVRSWRRVKSTNTPDLSFHFGILDGGISFDS